MGADNFRANLREQMELSRIAKRYTGLSEEPGKGKNNSLITSWLKLCLPDSYLGAGKFDETSWCSAFIHGIFIEAYGWGNWIRYVKDKDVNSLAKSWKRVNEGFYEVNTQEAQKGDIVILDRGSKSWQGHIGIFERIEGNKIYIIGGNQSNSVNVMGFPIWKLENIFRVEII